MKLDNAMTIAYLSMGPLLLVACVLGQSYLSYDARTCSCCRLDAFCLLPSWQWSTVKKIDGGTGAGESVCSDLDFDQWGSTCLNPLRVLLIFFFCNHLFQRFICSARKHVEGGLALLGFWLLITDEWINLSWPVTVRSGLIWRSSWRVYTNDHKPYNSLAINHTLPPLEDEKIELFFPKPCNKSFPEKGELALPHDAKFHQWWRVFCFPITGRCEHKTTV